MSATLVPCPAFRAIVQPGDGTRYGFIGVGVDDTVVVCPSGDGAGIVMRVEPWMWAALPDGVADRDGYGAWATSPHPGKGEPIARAEAMARIAGCAKDANPWTVLAAILFARDVAAEVSRD